MVCKLKTAWHCYKAIILGSAFIATVTVCNKHNTQQILLWYPEVDNFNIVAGPGACYFANIYNVLFIKEWHVDFL